MDSQEFLQQCKELSPGVTLNVPELTFDQLFLLKVTNLWYEYKIYAHTKCDFEMHVWNQNHPVELNITTHICPTGTRVMVWMISRLGDVGITDKTTDPTGYDCRIDIENLHNWEIRKIDFFQEN